MLLSYSCCVLSAHLKKLDYLVNNKCKTPSCLNISAFSETKVSISLQKCVIVHMKNYETNKLAMQNNVLFET